MTAESIQHNVAANLGRRLFKDTMKVRLGELRQVIRNVVSEGVDGGLPPGAVSGPGDRGGWTVELRGFAVTKPTQEEAEAAFTNAWPMMSEYFPEAAPRKPAAPVPPGPKAPEMSFDDKMSAGHYGKLD